MFRGLSASARAASKAFIMGALPPGVIAAMCSEVSLKKPPVLSFSKQFGNLRTHPSTLAAFFAKQATFSAPMVFGNASKGFAFASSRASTTSKLPKPIDNIKGVNPLQARANGTVTREAFCMRPWSEFKPISVFSSSRTLGRSSARAAKCSSVCPVFVACASAVASQCNLCRNASTAEQKVEAAGTSSLGSFAEMLWLKCSSVVSVVSVGSADSVGSAGSAGSVGSGGRFASLCCSGRPFSNWCRTHVHHRASSTLPEATRCATLTSSFRPSTPRMRALSHIMVVPLCLCPKLQHVKAPSPAASQNTSKGWTRYGVARPPLQIMTGMSRRASAANSISRRHQPLARQLA
mmetsp:Transcript_112335/g.356972  ORF Transcript_112335/g.356972 Transcript_112335/m.356972 type:complete len:349 (-) Transcript_112335:590-1636(-)